VSLTDDQRAMLRLLAQSDEGYEDIAALKGVSVEQVKSEVKAALTAAAEDEASGAAPGPRKPGISVPPERRRFLALAAGAVAVVGAILIAIALIGGGSSSSSSGSAAVGSASETASGEAEGRGNLTQAELQPVGGESGAGRALFGRVGKEEIVLQVAAQGLAPNAKGESYTVWLYRSPQVSLRVGAVKVGKSGRLGAQFPIPAELLAYVAGGAFKQIYVSRTADAAYQREVAQAKQQKKLPPYSGETVLRGEITGPIVKK